MAYKHLSLEERYYIEVSLKNEMNYSDIARQLHRSQPTISREIAQNMGQRGYRYQQAHRNENERHSNKNKAIKLVSEVKLLIEKYVRLDWSPEQICGMLKEEKHPKKSNGIMKRFINTFLKIRRMEAIYILI